MVEFSIFVPTFNRATTLSRALESISEQTFRDFEVIVVDDGSTDATPDVVDSWQTGEDFPIKYVRQANQGKHAAHNTALDYISGQLVVILDSDDALVPEALDTLHKTWLSIPTEIRQHFAGVEGLCISMANDSVVGDHYPVEPLDATYHQIRTRYGVKGDKKGAIRSEVLAQYPYPTFEGERHIRPSLIWERMSDHYLFRHINSPIQRIEYQPEGLSSDRFSLRIRNPKGYALYFKESAERFNLGARWRDRLHMMANFARFSFHGRVGFFHQMRSVNNRAIWLAAVGVGWLRFGTDLVRYRRRSER